MRGLKSVALIVLVLFIAEATAARKTKKPTGGEKIYDFFPVSMRSKLKKAWKLKVKRTEKQHRSIKRAATRERNKERKVQLKKLVLLSEASLVHLKTKNDPPFIGNNIHALHNTSRSRVVFYNWRVGDVGMCSKYGFKVFQVIDDSTVLLDSSHRSPHGIFMLKGFSTQDLTDENSKTNINGPLWVSGTTRYTTALGGTKTVYLVEPFDWEKWKKANVKK